MPNQIISYRTSSSLRGQLRKTLPPKPIKGY